MVNLRKSSLQRILLRRGNNEFDNRKNIKESQTLRESFIELAIEIFDLSFETWYQNGYWTDKYIPYAIVDEGKIIANAQTNSAILGFTPKDLSACTISPIEGGDDTLFIFKSKDNIFSQNKVMFPSLSHA